MKSQHQIWLDTFLDNCHQTNKSLRTINSYYHDLKKYIYWYELYHTQNLNRANAATISQYKDFLSKGGYLPVSYAPQSMGNSPRAKRNIWKKVKGIFSKWLKQKMPKETFDITPKGDLKGPIFDKIKNQKPLSISSRRRHLSAIKNFYEFLKQSNEDANDLFVANPVKSKLHGIKLKESDVNPTKLLLVVIGSRWNKPSIALKKNY